MSLELTSLIPPSGILPELAAKSKKQALTLLSEHAAGLLGVPQRDIFEALMHRERLGSTGLGRGIAIPHAKLKAVKQMTCIMARLVTPIDYDSLDGEPVDLIFLLLSGEHASGDHLRALAVISRLMRAPTIIARVRSARDAAGILSALSVPPSEDAA